MSLRQQLQDVGKKLVGAQHYNKDGCVNNRQDFNYPYPMNLPLLITVHYAALLNFRGSFFDKDMVQGTIMQIGHKLIP